MSRDKLNDLHQLEDNVAIITGATGVLGGSLADHFADAGVRVGILGRRQDVAERRSKQIREDGGEALPLQADVMKEDELLKARETVLDEWGRVDVLINAAGVILDGATVTPDQEIFDLNLDEVGEVLDVNLLGTVQATMVFAEPMVDRGNGSIINMSSMTADRAVTRVAGYSASKAAVENFTRWLSVEVAEKYGEGIRVNAIAPGFFIGEQNQDLLLDDDGSLSDRGETIIEHTPMDRFGQPEELAGTALWLAGEGSKFVTGVTVPVDGGFSAFSGV